MNFKTNSIPQNLLIRWDLHLFIYSKLTLSFNQCETCNIKIVR